MYQSRYTAGIWQSPAFMDVPMVDITAAQSTEQVPEAIVPTAQIYTASQAA